MPNYPLYPYQERKLYEERLTKNFPISGIQITLANYVSRFTLSEFREFQITTRVHKLGKKKGKAKRWVIRYENYVEGAFPDLWEDEESIQPKFMGFVVQPISPYTVNLPYKYNFSIRPSSRMVKLKERRMIDYTRTYQLNLSIQRDHYQWLENFLTAFFYCRPVHHLDFIEIEVKGETYKGEIIVLVPKQKISRSPFLMPIWGPAGFRQDTLKKLERFFSDYIVLSVLADQLKDRNPFVWCLTASGEPKPRRKGVNLDEEENIAKFFSEERGVEYYRSVDKRSEEKVDTLILEYDTPLRMNNPEWWWEQTVKDEERDLQSLYEKGLDLESVEENFSGNKSLQRLIHINPPISYEEVRDIQFFLAVRHVFEAAENRYMYTTDRDGCARIWKELADYRYGKKKEIKCVPTPNVNKAPVHCSAPLRFFLAGEKVKFHDLVYRLKIVKSSFSNYMSVLKRLHEEEGRNLKSKLYKPQSFFEEHATNPDVFRRLMEEEYWYVEAMKQVEPAILDLWKKEWILDKFS